MAATDTMLWILLGGVVLPLWLLAGFADYACHARTKLAHTSGVHESLLHLVETAEIGVPMLAFLFLQPTALVLAVMAAGVAAHAWSSWRDFVYADPRRRIGPGEQYIHAFLTVLPWAALVLVLVLHRDTIAAVFDPTVAADWGLRWRRPALDDGLLLAILGAALLLGVLPGLLELAHALRVRRQARAAGTRVADLTPGVPMPSGRGPRRSAQASSSSARSATKPR